MKSRRSCKPTFQKSICSVPCQNIRMEVMRIEVLQCVVVCCSVLQCIAVGVASQFLSPLNLQICLWYHLVQLLKSDLYSYVLIWHTAIHCNTLQHTATHCNTSILMTSFLCIDMAHCNTLQHTAIHCNTLQHTATPLFS